ncbi:cytochrome P450 [Trametes sanguinea]|nr:cytochrome P450 [Trametes sanguinea]
MFLSGATCLYLFLRTYDVLPYPASVTTCALISIYAVTALTITALYRLSPWHPLAAYPGPRLAKLTTLWLSYVSYTGKRYEIIDALHIQYGPFLRIGPNHLTINSASATSLYLNTEKSEAYRHPAHNGHVALFFKQDAPEHHRARKRVWSGFFTPTSVAGLLPQLDRRTWELIQCLEVRQSQDSHGAVNLATCLYHWAHDFMGDMVFGGCNAFELMKYGDPAGIIQTGKIALGLMDSVGQTQWLLNILWHLSLTKPMRAVERLAAQMMRTRAESVDLPEYRDLASYLLEADIPMHELETDAIVAIIGGSDNTSITTSLAIFFLLSHREYYDRLRKELDAAFPDPMCSLQTEELTALPFLNGVINETLRLASPYYNPRVVPSPGVSLDGRYIPEGTIAAISAHSVQTSADNFYPASKSFHPERWLPEGLGPQTVTNKAVLASFSFGPYYCIGRSLAYHQMRYALTRLMLSFDMEFEQGFDAKAFRGGILNMRTMFLTKELRVIVRRRPGVSYEKLVF